MPRSAAIWYRARVNNSEHPTRDPDLGGVKVLLVDDDADGREMVHRILRGGGADVVACASAAEALESFETRIPTVIVCDLVMPEIDGLAFLAQVRAREERRGIRCIPALALTGLDPSATLKDAARAGFQVYLQKPIEPQAFLRSVAKLASENAI